MRGSRNEEVAGSNIKRQEDPRKISRKVVAVFIKKLRREG